MSFGDIRDEWRLNDIERKLRDKAENHEISALRGEVACLERANRELGSEVAELRSQLQGLQESLTRLSWNLGVNP